MRHWTRYVQLFKKGQYTVQCSMLYRSFLSHVLVQQPLVMNVSRNAPMLRKLGMFWAPLGKERDIILPLWFKWEWSRLSGMHPIIFCFVERKKNIVPKGYISLCLHRFCKCCLQYLLYTKCWLTSWIVLVSGAAALTLLVDGQLTEHRSQPPYCSSNSKTIHLGAVCQEHRRSWTVSCLFLFFFKGFATTWLESEYIELSVLKAKHEQNPILYYSLLSLFVDCSGGLCWLWLWEQAPCSYSFSDRLYDGCSPAMTKFYLHLRKNWNKLFLE